MGGLRVGKRWGDEMNIKKVLKASKKALK